MLFRSVSQSRYNTRQEDDSRYKKDLEIKKSNVINRLKDLINLNDSEVSEISIVGVSANPFDMGIEHWLSNIEDFKRLSHIKTLQDETSSKIEKNGGVVAIANETKKTIIKDILEKQVPISRELNQRILEELGKLSEISTIMNREIQSLEPEIRAKKLALKEFTIDTFTNLIRQAQGTYRDWETDRKSTRLNSSHSGESRMPSSA